MAASEIDASFAGVVKARAAAAQTREDVERLTAEVALELQAQVCVGLHLRNERNGLALHVTFGCAPRTWRDQYCEAGHLQADPLIEHAFNQPLAASWGDLSVDMLAQPAAKAALSAAAGLNIHDAFLAPLRRTSAAVAAILFAGFDLKLGERHRRHDLMDIAAALQTASDRLGISGGGRGRRLTERETETVYWVALELSDKEAAGRMKCAPATASRHLRAAQHKLGATGRLGTVARATELGLLPLWMPQR